MQIGIGLSLTRAGGVAFSPAALFAAGEQGAWYDPSDLNSMYQDSAGTTAAVVGQPVGKILDKSGRGNHATQATSASRPTLQQDGSGFYYLSFDGFDDSLVTSAIDFSATDKMTVWAGVYKASDAAAGCLVEHGDTVDSLLFAPRTAAGNYGSDLRGGGLTSTVVIGTYTAPIANVIVASMDRAAATIATEIVFRVNGASPGTSSPSGTGPIAGNFTSNPLYIGRRAGTSIPFNGRIYSLIVRGAASNSGEIAAGERYTGSKMGITL